ncbi:MAG: glycoside hydrolase family 43 protein [Pseudoxanthomonas sp.]
MRARLPKTLALLLLLAPLAGQAATSGTFTNPLLASGPDPWITRQGSTYFFMSTRGDRIAIRRTNDLGQLQTAEEITVWTPPQTGPNAKSIWAPELHRIDGAWFIYYTASDDVHNDDAHRGVFVLENKHDDPTSGQWIDHGRLHTAQAGIDGTTFVDGGKRYFVYSPYLGQDSVLSIVAMSNPWTLTGKEAIIARPDSAWERQGGRQILEGPQFLRGPRGDVLLSYSGSACWSDDYAVGLLQAKAGSDLLQAASWSKSPAPILAKDPERGVFAPGHNGFFDTPDGRETWIVYHANPQANMQCTGKRAPRLQRVRWSGDGLPTFDRAEPLGTPQPHPGT